jgi:CDP-diacylglycerol---glycerol-3-phosphate 3-phosphatidyltransferase
MSAAAGPADSERSAGCTAPPIPAASTGDASPIASPAPGSAVAASVSAASLPVVPVPVPVVPVPLAPVPLAAVPAPPAPLAPVPAAPVPAVPLLNVANAVTVVRIVLVPVFVVLLLSSGMSRPGWQVAAALAFIVASLTDYVDGWIARTWHMVTSFGKVADPIADKALTGTALVLLSGYGRLAWWITVVILVREIGVTVLRFWVIRRGVLAASRGGKAKTALQILGISWLTMPFPAAVLPIGTVIMLAATAVTVVTGLDYVLRALRLRRAVSGPGSGVPR